MSQLGRKVTRLTELNGTDIPNAGSLEGQSANLLSILVDTMGADSSLIDITASLLERQYQALKITNDYLSYPIDRVPASIRERIYLELEAYNDGAGITVDRNDGSTSINERIVRELNAFIFTTFFWLLEDSLGFWELEDSISLWLLEEAV